MVHDVHTDPPDVTGYDAEFEAYMLQFEREREVARARRHATPPMKWGTDLGDNSYFCVPCWRSGLDNGAHSHDIPPCDARPRGPYDPR